MKFDLPIPPELAHLKRDERGYPIPFFVSTKNGKPQFQLLAAEKQLICIDKKLCPICGKKLHKEAYYFVCGPIGLYNRFHSDPAMHRLCAEFSMQACPHLYYEHARRREIKGPGAETVIKAEHQARHKPTELFLAKASKFWKEPGFNNTIGIRFTLVSWQRYEYKDGLLEIDDSPKGRGGSSYQLSPENEAIRQGAGTQSVLNSLNQKRKER